MMLGGLPYSITASLIMQIGNQVAGRYFVGYRKPTDFECPECGTNMDDTCDGFYVCDECGNIIEWGNTPTAPGNAQQQVQADSPDGPTA